MSLTSENKLSTLVVKGLLNYLNNLQTAEELLGASSVGLGLAADILAARDSLGGSFSTLQELEAVSGITDSIIFELIELVTVSLRKPKPIELFRFMHIAKPDAYINNETRQNNFIDPPKVGDSYFRNQMVGEVLQEDILARLKTAAQDFTPLKTLSVLRERFSNMYEFALWLKKHKRSFDLSTLANAVPPAELEATDRYEIWDNIFYQGITNESPKIRNILMMIIQADNFYREYATYIADETPLPFEGKVKEKFHCLAKASLIIPSSMVYRRISKPRVKKTLSLDSFSQDILVKKLKREVAKDNLNSLQEAKRIFDMQVASYNMQNQEESKQAQAQYQSDMQAYRAGGTYDEQTGAWSNPEMEQPSLAYTQSQTFNDYLEENVIGIEGETIQHLIEENLLSIRNASIETIEKAFTEKMEKVFKQLIKNPEKGRGVIEANGARIPVNNEPLVGAIAISLQPNLKGGKYSIYLTQYFQNKKQKVVGANIDVVYVLPGEKADHNESSRSLEPISESENYVTYRLFPDGIYLPDSSRAIQVTTNLEIDDEIYLLQIPNGPIFPGGTTTSPTTGTDPSTDTDTDIDTGIGGLDGLPGHPLHGMYGVTKLGVAEFKRVEQEICCYVEGEVSHIENVLAREYKERATRNTVQSEVTTEETSEREVEDITDTTSTDRHELQKEVSSYLEKQQAFNFSASASVQAGAPAGPKYSASTNMGLSTTSSSGSNENEAEVFAREVTEHASRRIFERVTSKRTSRILREYEETNKHGFDNRDGTEHVTGVYRWVNKIYNNRLMNYGKRLIYEFAIPEPARNFRYFMTAKKDPLSTLVPPVDPSEYNVVDSNDIDAVNYTQLAALYGVEVPVRPNDQLVLSKGFSGDTVSTELNTGGKMAKSGVIELPDGYKSYAFNYVCGYETNYNNYGVMRVKMQIGENLFEADGGGGVVNPGPPSRYFSISPFEKEFPVSFATNNVGAFSINVTVKCSLTAGALRKWRDECFLAIMSGYYSQKAAYDDAMSAMSPTTALNDDDVFKDFNGNPLSNRAIEQRELKRVALELILDAFSGATMGREHYWEYTWMDNFKVQSTSPEFARHAAHVKFLETAVDWDLMYYTFYPYYWANEKKWRELLHNTCSSDFIFESFLQSGMANMRVPVRLGYEKAFMYYLDTGLIWEGGDMLSDGNDEEYVALEAALAMPAEPEPEAMWQTTVPTSLTIVQDYSAPLKNNGLPCCENGMPIGYGSSLLGQPTEEPIEVEN